MFWTNIALKGHARSKLQGRWPIYLAVTLVYMLITDGINELISLAFPQYAAQLDKLMEYSVSGTLPEPELLYLAYKPFAR